ncbi:MAG: glycosyltransferase family 4 protein [Burkholderiales bacterium]|nr:glycosyltransferase family 4 protein [Burkholderiales bacterium]
MRVALDLRPLQSPSRLRGIGIYLRGLLGGFLQQERDLVLLTWRDRAVDLDLPEGCCFFHLPPPRPRVLGWLRDRLLLAGTFRQLAREVDLVHFTSPFELDMGWPQARLGIPRVITVHDLVPVTHARLVLQGRHRLLTPVYRWQARQLGRAEGLVSDSQATRRRLEEFLGHTPPIRVVPLAAEGFRVPDPARIHELRRRLDLPEDFLLFLGGASPNKNLEGLLVALQGGGLPPLVVAGSANPEHLANLRFRYPDLPVRWLGPVPAEDLEALYGAATAFVFPSLQEGFGLPVLEAMSCGTPVACSNTSSLPEVAGRAALFFDPVDPRQIRQALRRLASEPDLRARLRELGLNQARQFSWQHTARLTWQTYQDFLARSS